ncbi:MAG: nucleotidyltransferase family protein [Planctomycetota bacterium]|jgi:predicted nucleotidyltransferase
MTDDALLRRLGVGDDAISAFCRKWRVAELAVFGSVLRDDFGEGSDVDVLVSFEDAADLGLWDVMPMREELASLIGRDVDLLERHVVRRSRNYIRLAHILSTARVLYAA